MTLKKTGISLRKIHKALQVITMFCESLCMLYHNYHCKSTMNLYKITEIFVRIPKVWHLMLIIITNVEHFNFRL